MVGVGQIYDFTVDGIQKEAYITYNLWHKTTLLDVSGSPHDAASISLVDYKCPSKRIWCTGNAYTIQ